MLAGCGARSGLDVPSTTLVTLTLDGGEDSAPTTSSSPAGIVLFGGQGPSGTLLGDTWVFDGATWSPRDVSGPSARAGAAAATLNGKVVLFGGSDVSGLRGDTWEWDGTSWTERSGPGPSPRSGAAVSTLNGKVVLFGGVGPPPETTGGSYYGDTWEWDGTSWTQRAVSGPPARGEAAAATLNGKVVLFGGGSNASAPVGGFNDTWEWDGTSWTPHGALPALYAENDAVLATLDERVVLYGGSGDTFEWDGTTWAQESVPGPPARVSAMAATLLGRVVLFGGAPEGTLNQPLGETWEWDGSAWAQLDVSGPTPRDGSAMSTL